MSCDAFITDLAAYLDGELVGNQRPQLEEHLAQCRPCRDRLEGYRALKHAVGALEGRTEPSEAVRAHVEALRYAHVGRRPWRRWLSFAGTGGLAAALAAAVLFAVQPSTEMTDARALIEDHLAYVPEAMPAEVASTAASDVQAFFADKLPFEPVIPDVPGASLIGGRLCRIEGRSVELIFYERAGTTLSLYVSDQNKGESCSGMRGYHVCSRTRGNLTYTMVGGLPRDELEELLNATP